MEEPFQQWSDIHFWYFVISEPEEKLYTNSMKITHFIRLILIYHCIVYGGVTTKSKSI